MCRTMNELEKVIADYRSLKAMKEQLEEELKAVEREIINKYLLLLAKEQIKLAFEQSEKEVHDLRQRTREGLQTAKLAGKQIGQIQGQKLVTKKSIAAKEIIQKHNKAFGGSLNDAETIRQTGISKKTFYKYKKELLSSQSL